MYGCTQLTPELPLYLTTFKVKVSMGAGVKPNLRLTVMQSCAKVARTLSLTAYFRLGSLGRSGLVSPRLGKAAAPQPTSCVFHASYTLKVRNYATQSLQLTHLPTYLPTCHTYISYGVHTYLPYTYHRHSCPTLPTCQG